MNKLDPYTYSNAKLFYNQNRSNQQLSFYQQRNQFKIKNHKTYTYFSAVVGGHRKIDDLPSAPQSLFLMNFACWLYLIHDTLAHLSLS